MAEAPFHEGEAAVQERCGVRDKMEQVGSHIIRDAMPAQHQEFFAKLPTLLVGSLDAERRPWASILVGRPGFARALNERTLRIAERPARGDPLARNLAAGAPLGLLGIEPHTRRRNRLNGTIVDVGAEGFTVGVDQSFGNCPQYIQAREPQWVREPASFTGRTSVALGDRLSDAAAALVRRVDTFFIASAAPHARGRAGAQGVDVSHRGGKPGFVRLTDVLTIPDFRGNYMFNTLGNITAYPRAGLLFVDYESGDVLQTTGAAQVIWEGAELEAFAGAQRLLRVTVEQALWMPQALPLRWSAPHFAGQLADTGEWPDATS